MIYIDISIEHITQVMYFNQNNAEEGPALKEKKKGFYHGA